MTQLTEVELVAWQPSGTIQTFVVKSNQSVLLGKSTNCGLQLSGHDISEIHCRIGFEGGELWVQDWMSATGTKVNGESVTTKTHFGQGCIVEIGNYKIQISKSNAIKHETQSREAAEPHAASPLADKNDPVQPARRTPDFVPKAPKPLRPVATERDSVADERRVEKKAEVTASFEPLSQDEEVYDRETVELLLAEIEDLRTALAQNDFLHANATASATHEFSDDTEESSQVVRRIKELSEEANRADERVLLLEEMLQAAEDANRSEVEERAHLEAWVGDIERRIGQREAEHAAELNALRARLDSAEKQNGRLQRQLQSSGTSDDETQQRNAELVKLQQENRQLQESLADARKELRQLNQKFENQSATSEAVLRQDLAKIAKEHAEMSRLKFEYAKKIRELEELPMPAAHADPSLQGLREHRQHLREMSQCKKEQPSLSLAGRLKRIWNRVENS